jgi:hypothetical protein
MFVIPATQEAEIKRTMVQSQPRQIVHKTLSQKNLSQKKGWVKWLKVKSLSSSPSSAKQKKFQFTVLPSCLDAAGCDWIASWDMLESAQEEINQLLWK